MKTYNVIVIGAGLIGARHIELISRHPTCDCVGVCDTDPGRKKVADAYAIPFSEDLETLLKATRPDGAIIATPNAMHYQAAEICAAYGAHMLIEKPIAETIKGAQRIIAASRAHHVHVLVGHHRRHNTLIRKTRELITTGELGKFIGTSIMWALKKPDDYFTVEWRTQQFVGGPTLINLVHDLDSLRFMCGEITEVYAHARSEVRGLEVEDTLSITLTFQNGGLGTILASDAAASPWSYESTAKENPYYFHTDQSCYHFLGTEGALAFPSMELWKYENPSNMGWQHPMKRIPLEIDETDPLESQLNHFLNIIEGNASPILDAEDGTRSLAVALAVQQSALNHVPVNPAELIASASSKN